MNFHLGINYWPISSAMYWWQRFDVKEFSGDATRIRTAGLDSIRIFLLWEDFQPTPNQISKTALENLNKVANIAGSEGLSLIVTLFTGHMSGANWLPGWAIKTETTAQRFPIVSEGRVLPATPRNWYADKAIMKAQALLAREVAGTLSGHRAIWAWDLGNENSNCVVPPTHEAGIEWLETMAAEIKSVDPYHEITLGLHMEDLEQDRKLGPTEAARVCDFLCMHGYPIYCDWADGPTDALLLPFLGLIIQWLGERAVLFQEFGAPTIPYGPDNISERPEAKATVPLLTESEAAGYISLATGLLTEYGFSGAMLWCFGDYAQALWDLPPLDRATHERYFGLWRQDGTPKQALSKLPPARQPPTSHPVDNFQWIDVKAEDFYSNPKENLRRLYQRFRSINERVLKGQDG
jgi:endo-1,4-beta-mannosidase